MLFQKISNRLRIHSKQFKTELAETYHSIKDLSLTKEQRLISKSIRDSYSDQKSLEISVSIGCGRLCDYCPQMLQINSYNEEFGDSKSEDRWYDKATYVDLNANYNLRENISIYADFNNLTNQPLHNSCTTIFTGREYH